MTTIAASKKSIACDLQVSWNGGYKFRTTTKIFGLDANEFVPEPFYIGYAGRVETAHKVIGWLRDGGKRPKNKDTDFIILTQKGKIITFRDTDSKAWIEVNELVPLKVSVSVLPSRFRFEAKRSNDQSFRCIETAVPLLKNTSLEDV